MLLPNIDSRQRLDLLEAIAHQICDLACDYTLSVAVDGVDGAGKTTFADELALILRACGKTVIRVSIDDFHAPKLIRYRMGRHSPEGFFRDSYDYSGLKKEVLDPLRTGGSGYYRPAIFDCSSDAPVSVPQVQALSNSILVLDGIFLHRPELRGYWDFSVFLDVAFHISIPRGAQRGSGFGSPDPTALANKRYIDGQKLYMQECDPWDHATVIVDNNNLFAPLFVAAPFTPPNLVWGHRRKRNIKHVKPMGRDEEACISPSLPFWSAATRSHP